MADTEPIRIVAIDDHPLILNALVRRLEAGGDTVRPRVPPDVRRHEPRRVTSGRLPG